MLKDLAPLLTKRLVNQAGSEMAITAEVVEKGPFPIIFPQNRSFFDLP
jgi:hypothetical protein